MKIPVQRLELKEIGYADYWIEMPKSIKEGYLHEFSKLGQGAGADADDADQSRASNIKILELVTAWNIDGDDEKILTLPAKCKTQAEKEKVVGELPVDVIVYIAQRIAGTVQVPEKTKDF